MIVRDNMLKILAVSFAFPPSSYPRAVQVARLLSYTDASITMICADDHNIKQNGLNHNDLNGRLEDLLRISYKRGLLAKFRFVLSSRLGLPTRMIPDDQRLWVERAFKEYSQWNQKKWYTPDVLITFGQPMSDHLFGIWFKEQHNDAKWVAHFSDPWCDNPYLKDHPWAARANRKIEEQVINEADKVIFTSYETVDLVMKKYSANLQTKAQVLPHCYDPALYDAELRPPSDKYVIRSLGAFYGPRAPLSLFKAVEIIRKENPSLLEKVVIELIGSMGKYRNTLNNYPQLKEFIYIKPPVEYKEALQLMRGAHCLLVIDAPSEHSVFFPSKLADYLGAQRFVFAISPAGATRRIVLENGGYVANPKEIDSICNTLTRLLVEKPESIPMGGQESYHVKKIASDWGTLLESM